MPRAEPEASSPGGWAARYGDAAQNAGGLVLRLGALDQIGPVDPGTGLVTCGAGVSLDQLLREVLPRGWFVPVTPGTRQVSLGGAVAADVHGKNHHRDGSLSAHVASLTLIDGRGAVRTLTPSDDLFWSVPGGMGLTGVVVEVTLRLIRVESSLMRVDTTRTASLDETMAVLEESDRTRRYTVAWVDCLARGSATGRGVVTSGDHATSDEAGEATRPAFGRRTLPAPPGPLPVPSTRSRSACSTRRTTARLRGRPVAASTPSGRSSIRWTSSMDGTASTARGGSCSTSSRWRTRSA